MKQITLQEMYFLFFSQTKTTTILNYPRCKWPMSHAMYFCHNYCLFLLVYAVTLPGTSMAFMMIVSGFEKSHCLRKSSVSLLWQPNLITTLPTGVISKLMIETREPIPTYTLLNPVRLLWTWHFKHGVYPTKFPFPLLIIF